LLSFAGLILRATFMDQFFFDHFGVSPTIFSLVILPLFIFLARIIDVSINTIRIIYTLGGQKWTSTILGFFESVIWLLAIGQIFENLDSWISYLAYAGGYALGIATGMMIEERLALGKLVVRVISIAPFEELVAYMQSQGLRFTIVDGETSHGSGQILFTVVNRDQLSQFLDEVNQYHPNSFYTVEGVKKASETGFGQEIPRNRGIGSWLTSVKRK